MYNRNIIKYGWVEVKEEECVIESNKRIAKIMDELKAARRKSASETDGEEYEDDEEGFVGGLGAEQIDALEYDEDGNVLKAPEEAEFEGPDLEEIRAQIDAELEAARDEVEKMKSLAKTEIDSQKRQAIEEGRKTGYSEGYQMAQNEAAKMKSELDAERRRLEAEYDQLIDELEPRFIETITDIYKHIFNIDLESHKDILVYLIESTLRRIESSKTFMVHVSHDDYAYVVTQKNVLIEKGVSGRGALEIVEDITLRKNECMIETDGGIFDCGVGTQLEELTKKLRLLSYSE